MRGHEEGPWEEHGEYIEEGHAAGGHGGGHEGGGMGGRPSVFHRTSQHMPYVPLCVPAHPITHHHVPLHTHYVPNLPCPPCL